MERPQFLKSELGSRHKRKRMLRDVFLKTKKIGGLTIRAQIVVGIHYL